MMVLQQWIGYACASMARIPVPWRRPSGWLPLFTVCLLGGCETVPAPEAPADQAGTGAGEAAAVTQPDPAAVLAMSFEEAKKVSPKSMEIAPFYKIAADEITVLKSDAAGQPRRVRARGKVFVQVDFREQLRALGQEVYIESDGELIVRGKPLLHRGRSVVEGLSDYTVYYIKGLRLQVIGSHRKTTQDAAGTPIVMPEWKRSWREGPNPLLPALSPEDVPRELRSSPLLPPVEGSTDLPQVLPPGFAPPTPEPPKGTTASADTVKDTPAPAAEAP